MQKRHAVKIWMKPCNDIITRFNDIINNYFNFLIQKAFIEGTKHKNDTIVVKGSHAHSTAHYFSGLFYPLSLQHEPTSIIIKANKNTRFIEANIFKEAENIK